MRIALSALAVGAAALAAPSWGSAQTGIVRQGASAAGATAGAMAGTVVGGPIGGAVGGVVGGAVGETTVKAVGAIMPGSRKKKREKAEAEARAAEQARAEAEARAQQEAEARAAQQAQVEALTRATERAHVAAAAQASAAPYIGVLPPVTEPSGEEARAVEIRSAETEPPTPQEKSPAPSPMAEPAP